jgi:superfamily II DNA or RNA helicase
MDSDILDLGLSGAGGAFVPRPYQIEAFRRILGEFEREPSTFCVLPTGTGKTELMVMLAKHFHLKHGGRTLILAHTDELTSQAFNKLTLRGIEPALEKAERKALQYIEDARYDMLEERLVYTVVGSVQTMRGKRLLTWPRDYFDLIICDEAHRGLAPSYRNIVKHFQTARHVGVTATGDKLQPASARKVYRTLAYEYTITQAVDDGYLVRPVGDLSGEKVDLSGIEVTGDDFNVAQLEDRISPQIESLVNGVREKIGDRQFILFAPASAEGSKVSPSQIWAAALKKVNIRAEAISGKSWNRKELLQQFERKEIQGLTNCALLIEGYDYAGVGAVILARPTLSRQLMAQMVGRGLRIDPANGKKDCLVIDFPWVTELGLVSPLEVMSPSGTVPEVVEKAKKLIADGDVTDMMDAIAYAEELEKIEAAKRAEVARQQAEKELRLNVKIRESKIKWKKSDLIGGKKAIHSIIDAPAHDNVITRFLSPSQGQIQKLIAKGVTEADMAGITRRQADAWLDWMDDRSRSGLCSYKQVRFLMNQGIPKDKAVRYTRQQASDFIGDRMSRWKGKRKSG